MKRGSLLFVILSFLSFGTATAGLVTGDISTGTVPGVGGGINTLGLSAISKQSVPTPIGPNARVNISTATPDPPIRVGNTSYRPAIGVVGGKPTSALGRTLESASGEIAGVATYDVATKAISATGVNRSIDPTTGRGTVGGQAAARALDPIEVAPGSYSYQIPITASLAPAQLAGESDVFAGLEFYALDSRYTNLSTFGERGEPFDEALWSLFIGVTKVPSSITDIDIEFDINDQALADGALVLPLKPDGSPFTEDDIEGLIRAAFSVSSDAASATFVLFPAGTTFNVSGGVIQYGVGVNAGLGTPVPEPGTLALLGVGALSLLGYGLARAKVGISPPLSKSVANSSTLRRRSPRPWASFP